MLKARPYFIIIAACFLFTSQLKAQRWQRGCFYDLKGNKETGLIRIKPGGKGPVKDEAFIEFRANDKDNPFKLSASDLKAIVIEKDSFVVAAEPRTDSWRYYLDFVKVVIDGDIKLYVFYGSGGGGIGISPAISGGIGTGVGGGGGYGGVGAGVSIPIGGGGRGGGNKTVYYFGANTAEMKPLNNSNFVDIMSDIMGDDDTLADQIRENKYNMGNIEKLIAQFERDAHGR